MAFKLYSITLRRVLNRWPGKRYLGEYRFLPLFFVLGASLEYSMINWKVGNISFYNTYKQRQAKNIIEAEHHVH